MRRDQLEHAIRAACQIIDAHAVIVVGSQAILGTYREDQLAAQATMSAKVDILPIGTSVPSSSSRSPRPADEPFRRVNVTRPAMSARR